MITAGSQHLKKVELGEGEQFAAGAHCSARGKLARPIEEEAADVVHLLLVLLLLLRCHCTMCCLYSMFSFQPNKVRLTLKFLF